MAVKWNFTGNLDINADPLDLPGQVSGNQELSGAMTRCTNLDLSYAGAAKTRNGTSEVSLSDAGSGDYVNLHESGGDRIAFTEKKIYFNESVIESSLDASGEWAYADMRPWASLYDNVFCTNGVERLRIESGTVYEWGIDAPSAAPTLAGGMDYATTQAWEYGTDGEDTTSAWQFTVDISSDDWTLTGCYDWEIYHIEGSLDHPDTRGESWTYYFEEDTSRGWYACKYTYCRKRGDTVECESNPSPIAWVVIESGLYVQWAVPADTQITHVRIYRGLANLSDLYWAEDFDVDLGGAVVQTVDTELGSQVEEDHDRPPVGGKVLAGPSYNNYLFMTVGGDLYWCKSQQPEYWPSTNYVNVSPAPYELTGLAFLGGSLYAASQTSIWQITGSGTDTFLPIPQSTQVGTHSSRIFTGIKGYGIFHLGADGLYVYTTAQSKKITDRFDPIFRGVTTNGIPGISSRYISRCDLLHHNGSIWFFWPSDEEVISDCLVIDLNSNRASHYQFSHNLCSVCYDKSQGRILGITTGGTVYDLNYDTATDDAGEAIAWTAESKEFGNLRRHFPRAARWDVSLDDDETTATGSIYLDGTAVQSHSLTTSRQTKRRLVEICNGNRLSLRLTGSGPATLHSAEVE